MFILGKLCDASARYERAIQEEPNEIGHHKVTDCNVSSFMGKLILTKASYHAINQTGVPVFNDVYLCFIRDKEVSENCWSIFVEYFWSS